MIRALVVDDSMVARVHSRFMPSAPTVRVEISVAYPGTDPGPVWSLVDEPVRHLRRDIDDNFNAG